MLAEAGQASGAGDAIALARHGSDAPARREEEPFVGAGAAERGEEGDVTARVDRRHDGHRLGPEAIEHAAAGRGSPVPATRRSRDGSSPDTVAAASTAHTASASQNGGETCDGV